MVHATTTGAVYTRVVAPGRVAGTCARAPLCAAKTEGSQTMAGFLGAVADRMVSAFVPKTTAGACPCNDVYYSKCSNGMCKRCRTNCNCTVTTCSSCTYASGNC